MQKVYVYQQTEFRSYLNPRQSYKYFGFGKTNVSHFNWNFIPVAT